MTDRAEREQGWAELRHWGRERELGELDALMWRTERPPAGSWSGLVMQLLDDEPDWERLWAAHEWFVQIVPRFRERVVEPALPVGTPEWAPDPAFDLHYHLRRVRLAEPGTRAELLELAQELALTPLDRSRPPWVGTLVTGLEHGRAAYLLQAHHVFMDGMALTQLLRRVLSPIRETTPGKPTPAEGNGARTGSLEVTGRELARQTRAAPGLAPKLLRTVASAVTDPAGAARYAASLGRVLAPPPANPSRILRGGSRRQWRFGTLECELTDLKAAGKAAGGTVNDTFVCVLLGGLRHYSARFGEDLGDVPISMPVAMRKPDEAMGGNKFAGAFFAVPSGVDDPGERIAELHRRVERVRSEPALDFLGHLTPVLNRTPSGLAAALLGSINARAVLTTSSWPGVQEELFVAGARFERMFVFAPLPGTVLTGAMCTHVGVCCIGINVDGQVITDTDALWEDMQRSLDEVLALAPSGPQPAAPQPPRNSSSANRKADRASNIG
jgi:WS/DGAT/MGAT family acyltransferase